MHFTKIMHPIGELNKINMKNKFKFLGVLIAFSVFTISCNQHSTKDYSSSTEQKVIPKSPQGVIDIQEEVINKQEDKFILREEVLEAEEEPQMESLNYNLNKAYNHYPHPPINKAPEITESYANIKENKFKVSTEEPLSTFSLDVDRASYSNVRRMLLDGVKPDPNAVRIEEMINYFNYNYDTPKGKHPIQVNHELTTCPWNAQHQILHLGIQATELDQDELPSSNIVFLMDVSGSMNQSNKLPLVKSSFKLLLSQLKPTDRVAIVTYAGNAGIALESTEISEKKKILKALESLQSGGSTAGAQGIKSAYAIAEENFIEDGNNRIILATDGDFNVGINSPDKLKNLIEKKRKSGVYLSVLGFGTGNYKDHQMQVLADAGNGNHSYIDNLKEAQKILIKEFGGTLFTVAKDVKIQIEFNPSYVGAYRLIGYENRLLNKEDFNDDTKDAGEIGIGHSMTAIYEIVPTGVSSNLVGSVDALKYQNEEAPISRNKNNELATIKFRYKNPKENTSIKFENIVSAEMTSFSKTNENVRFALAVANFGMHLRDSNYLQDSNLDDVIKLANDSKGIDNEGEKAECIQLIKLFKQLIEIGEE